MDSNDATILALALGIPSTTLLSIAFLLALRIQHRQLQARRIPNPTVPTNFPAPSPPPVDPYYGIPLKQRPPRILAPIPQQPIPLHEFGQNSEGRARGGFLSRLLPSYRRQGLLPLPEGARLSSSSPSPTLPMIPWMPLDLPHPANTPITEITAGDSTWAATYESPPPPTCDHTWDADPPAPSAPVSPNEFWDNITIPLSAYIPNPRDGSPEHRTPPPDSAYMQHRGAPNIWGQPVPTWELTFEPVPVKEPVTSSLRLPVPDSNDSSYWSNVIE